MKMFPETKFIGENTILEQLDHLHSEYIEVKKALLELIECEDEEVEEKTLFLKLELLDIKHSADTMLCQLGVTESEHIKLCDMVVRKNFRRGYYKTKKESPCKGS